MEKTIEEFTRYERARILGARALQISMNAPVLLKMSDKEINDLGYDSLKIAQKELDEKVLPISIHRPLPKKRESKLKIVKLSGEEKTSEKKSELEDDSLMEELDSSDDFEEDSNEESELE